MMKVLVTGANGFIGKNLIAELNNIREGKTKVYPVQSDLEIISYDVDTDPEQVFLLSHSIYLSNTTDILKAPFQ